MCRFLRAHTKNRAQKYCFFLIYASFYVKNIKNQVFCLKMPCQKLHIYIYKVYIPDLLPRQSRDNHETITWSARDNHETLSSALSFFFVEKFA